MQKRRKRWFHARWLRVTGVLLLAVIFVLPIVVPTFDSPPPVYTPTVSDPLARPFPTVPPGGFPVVVTGTYFHPSGVFSLPRIEGWNLPTESPEELVLPTPGLEFSRAGTTFMNSMTSSVLHVFAEHDPASDLVTVEDLDAYYTQEALDSAWNRYSDWREVSRRAEGDSYVINFALDFNEQTYIGRQVSRVEQGWLMVVRMVVPGNNPQLLEDLHAAVVPAFRLWSNALAVPLDWITLADAGYMIRYPPTWQQRDGSPGRPYTISGKLGQHTFQLVTRRLEGEQIETQSEARDWVMSNVSRATIQTLHHEVRNLGSGYSVSYLDADADGNRRSNVITLLSGPDGALYVANLQMAMGGPDLLEAGSAPAELAQIRSTFSPTGVAQLPGTPEATPGP